MARPSALVLSRREHPAAVRRDRARARTRRRAHRIRRRRRQPRRRRVLHRVLQGGSRGRRHAPGMARHGRHAHARGDALVLLAHRGGDCRTGLPIVAHLHNDYGLGTINAIAATSCGFKVISVTANGYGERAGNVKLHEFVVALRVLYGIEIPGFKYDKLRDLARFMERMSGIPMQQHEPIVGTKVFAHESGIHTHAMLIDHRMYEAVPVGTRRRRDELRLRQALRRRAGRGDAAPIAASAGTGRHRAVPTNSRIASPRKSSACAKSEPRRAGVPRPSSCTKARCAACT